MTATMDRIMTAKETMQSPIQCVEIGATVADALTVMDENEVDFLPVVASGTGKLLGAVRRKPLSLGCRRSGHAPETCRVQSHLKIDIDFCFEGDRIDEVFGEEDEPAMDRIGEIRRKGRLEMPVIVVDAQKVPIGLLDRTETE